MKKADVKLGGEYAVRLSYGTRGPVTRCKVIAVEVEEEQKHRGYSYSRRTMKGSKVETLEGREIGWTGETEKVGEKLFVENKQIIEEWGSYSQGAEVSKIRTAASKAVRAAENRCEEAHEDAFAEYVLAVGLKFADDEAWQHRGLQAKDEDGDRGYNFPSASEPREFLALISAAFESGEQTMEILRRKLDKADARRDAAVEVAGAARDKALAKIGEEPVYAIEDES